MNAVIMIRIPFSFHMMTLQKITSLDATSTTKLLSPLMMGENLPGISLISRPLLKFQKSGLAGIHCLLMQDSSAYSGKLWNNCYTCTGLCYCQCYRSLLNHNCQCPPYKDCSELWALCMVLRRF